MNRILLYCLGITAIAAAQYNAACAGVPQAEPFGHTAGGEPVDRYTLSNDRGMTAKLMTRGATLVQLHVPDRNGTAADVVLGFDDVAGYESEANQYFGCTVGRVANRIAQGKFTLDGREYTLAVNNGPNHLHGGVGRSLDKVVWSAHPYETDAGQGVVFRYVSPHGEEGYPGTLSIAVDYLLAKKSSELTIRYRATTDQATPVNLSNHSYFNLNGCGSPTVLDHVLTLHCDRYTPVDDTLIPTGDVVPVAGTPLDFRTPHRIGERVAQLDDTSAMGYDHNLIVNGTAGTVRPVARLEDPVTGRVLELLSDQPGVQFYGGNFLFGQQGKGKKTYPHRSALCLETQHYPDSVNRPQFPSTILRPGEVYTHTATYRFSAQ